MMEVGNLSLFWVTFHGIKGESSLFWPQLPSLIDILVLGPIKGVHNLGTICSWSNFKAGWNCSCASVIEKSLVCALAFAISLVTASAIALARAASLASWFQLRSLLDWWASQGLVMVSEEIAVSPSWGSLSLFLSFPIVCYWRSYGLGRSRSLSDYQNILIFFCTCSAQLAVKWGSIAVRWSSLLSIFPVQILSLWSFEWSWKQSEFLPLSDTMNKSWCTKK